MLVIGSQALSRHGILDRQMGPDLDVIATPEEIKVMLASYDNPEIIEESFDKVIFKIDDLHIEADLTTVKSNLWLLNHYEAMEGIHYAELNLMYALKMSHRFKKDSPHFYKTMHDIRLLRRHDAVIPPELEDWYNMREEETYDYAHPNLNVSKDDFFNGDDIPYEYDHDSIHKAIAVGERPAYLEFKPKEDDVLCSEDLFYKCSYGTALYSVYEEAAVLALERSVVPFGTDADEAFRYALMKLCTSISSGWWRHFAWNNHHKVIDLHERMGVQWYVDEFNKNIDMVKPYK